MQTRTCGKLVAHLAGASLVATSTLGAAAVAVETYGDLQSTETATANSPVTEQTSPSATETSTGTSSSSTTGSSSSSSTTYVQQAPAGSTSHTTSSGS